MDLVIGIGGFLVFILLYAAGVYLRQQLLPDPKVTARKHTLYALLGFLGVMALMFPIISLSLTTSNTGALLSVAVLTLEQGFFIPMRLSRLL